MKNNNYALRFMQNELNAVLNSFLNGGFSKKGFVLYPFYKDVSEENKGKLKGLRETAVFLNNNGYDFSDSIDKFKGSLNNENFSILLSSLYQDFSKIKSKSTKTITKSKCKRLDLSKYEKSDLKYLSPLKELNEYTNKNLKHYLSGFYLHGSLATKDYVKGWSDVDTLAIVSKEAIEEPNALLGLRDKMYFMRRYFYRIDPLQHHGSIVISEYDLENYCQAYFPVPVFKYAKSFFENDEISKIKARDFSSEAASRLFWFVDYFRKLRLEKRFNLGSYDLKVLLHSITLFPTIYLQAKGILVYKKFSFDIAKKDFSSKIWKVVDDASLIRSNWKGFSTSPLIKLYSKTNPLLAYQLNSRLIDLVRDIKKENNIDAKNIIENMHKLSEEAWSKIKGLLRK